MSKNKLVVLGIIILAVLFLPGYSRLQELRNKNRSLLEKIEALKEENQSLEQQIERLENDPVYIEKKAREKLAA